MIKTAIILAAGCGSRLRPHLDDELPKGALPLGNQSIIETSIQTLIECGINTIIIGPGHGDAYYNQLAMNYPQVLCIKNPIFDASGSMHTLSLLIPHVTSDALLLESDLIYEKRALTFAMDFPEDNLILATPFNNYGDEVFIDVDLNDQLKSMSKDRPH
ncbi:MAG: NTP transferase domain-containing protein, partial [Candidatus Margulisiibacteriota bacterium]